MVQSLSRSSAGTRPDPTARTRGALAALGLLAAAQATEAAPFDPGPTLADLAAVAAAAPMAAEATDLTETQRLKAGILCVAWARDMIDQHWRLLDVLDGVGTWSERRQHLWQQVGWVADFETRELRPVIDAASQQDLMAAWWPEGVRTPAGSAAAMRMHRFCAGLPGLLGTVAPDAPGF